VHKFVKSPLPLVASSSLAAISAALQAHIDVRRDEELCSPVGLFMMTIGDSGERKTQTDKMFTRAMQNYQDRQESDAVPIVEKYRTAIDAWLAKRVGIKRKITQATAKGESTETCEEELGTHDQVRPKLPRTYVCRARRGE